jgi:uncharacterized membrane protein
MNLVLWVLTGVLAVAFLAAGTLKIVRPRSELKERMPWVLDYTDGQIKGIGAVEVLGALGLVLPAVTGIAPVLVPLAATGLAITMLLAGRMHARRHEPIVANVVLGVLALVIAVSRFGPYPLS